MNVGKILSFERVVVAPVYEIDLDTPPEQRWNHVVRNYKEFVPDMVDYFFSEFSEVEAEMIEKITSMLEWFVGDLGKEMEAIATEMDADLGLIVALNYAYELRRLGGTSANVTEGYFPKACTSIVAEDPNENVFHGRNFDWNLPNRLRNLTFQCEFKKNNKVLFIGTCFAGYVGVLTGMRPQAYGITLNERDFGGSIFIDTMEAIFLRSWSPSHLVREILTTTSSYAQAKQILKSEWLTAPAYFIISGTMDNEGDIITRDRNFLPDSWSLDVSSNRWFILETNYDHWKPAPPNDNRRDYGIKYMNNMGRDGVNANSILSVLSIWPLNNNDTCYTTIMMQDKISMKTYIRFKYV